MKLRTAVLAGLLCSAGPTLAQTPTPSTTPTLAPHANPGQAAPAKPAAQTPPPAEKIDPAKDAAIRHLMDITESSKMGENIANFITGQVHNGVGRALEEWCGEISVEKPVVVLVDNVECADDSSLGLLAGLTKVAARCPLMVVVTECSSRERTEAIGLATLREHATVIELVGLRAHEMLELGRSLFGDAPGVERFTEWLRERTAGSPLHAIEVSRQLLTKGVIGYSAGVWTLPDEVPDAELPAALGDALSMRLALLSDAARTLAECLSLQRNQPTFELCSLLASHTEGGGVLSLLDELAEREVLFFEQDGYRFSSAALQDALLSNMDDARLERLGGPDHRELHATCDGHFHRHGHDQRHDC